MARLREALALGRPWFPVLLEAIALWPVSEEEAEGRHYSYLIGGEAFDWLLLAERLCLSLDGFIPPQEREALLFEGRPPVELSPSDLHCLLGEDKYQAHLNYFYGVTVEEALQRASAEEVHKELYSLGLANGSWEEEEIAFQRLYGKPRRELLARFRFEQDLPPGEEIFFAELKEFTYWLFKYRLRNSDRARLASDTRKALAFLALLRESATGHRNAPSACVLDLSGHRL